MTIPGFKRGREMLSYHVPTERNEIFLHVVQIIISSVIEENLNVRNTQSYGTLEKESLKYLRNILKFQQKEITLEYYIPFILKCINFLLWFFSGRLKISLFSKFGPRIYSFCLVANIIK